MNSIELINCSKSYEKNHKKIDVLRNINYKFIKGKFYVIMGESGSGKSTLINIISGLVKNDSGKILFDNKEVKDSNSYAKIRNENIGLVFQSFLLHDNLTSLENVMLPLFINGSNKNNHAFMLLDSLGLKDRINHYPCELSGGEMQRVAIARSLINNPDFILADEPTGNLDKKNEKFIFEYFKKISSNKCIIVVSHNEIIKKYADVILILKEGLLYEE